MNEGGAAAASEEVPGWYGKLSTLGDFASRRLPPAVVEALDGWLSQALAGSRQQLGEAWLQAYLDAPLQRFVLAPGLIAGAATGPWWFGLLMPSCDNVGRYFPLVILQPRAHLPAQRSELDQLEQWWQRAGEAALETLADSVDVQRFERALAELPRRPALSAASALPAWAQALAGPAGECSLPAGCAGGELAQGLAAASGSQRLHGHSLWWSWRPQGGASTCRIVPGWPGPELFAAMLEMTG